MIAISVDLPTSPILKTSPILVASPSLPTTEQQPIKLQTSAAARRRPSILPKDLKTCLRAITVFRTAFQISASCLSLGKSCDPPAMSIYCGPWSFGASVFFHDFSLNVAAIGNLRPELNPSLQTGRDSLEGKDFVTGMLY